MTHALSFLVATLFVFVVWSGPAEALVITEPRLISNCTGQEVPAGSRIGGDSCGVNNYLVAMFVGPFPVPDPPVVHFTLSLDGVIVQNETRLLPADLGPCPLCPLGHYTHAGIGFDWELDPSCCCDHVVPPFAKATLVGSLEDASVAFEILQPSPEPTTRLLFATTAAGLGLTRWYRRRANGQHDAA
jgi:hypothetical protein